MSLEHIIANNVLRYLPPRDLLHTVTCSKTMIDYLSYTIVIQTLLFGGLGLWSRHSLEAIINLLREGKIWKPTPLRILRLCLAKRCEAKKNCPGKPQHVNEKWGVFFCWSCIQKMGTEVKPSIQLLTDALRSPRVSKYSKYLLTKDHIRVKTERCGPLVTVQTLERLKKEGKTLDEFFASPEVTVGAPTNPQIMEIIKVYDDRAIWVRQMEEKEKLRKKEASQERSQAKKAKLDTVEARLEELLGDPDKAQKVDFQLDVETIQKSPHYELIIRDVKAAPSKATKKLLEEIANSTRLVFCGIDKDIFRRLSNPNSRFENFLLDVLNREVAERGIKPTSHLISRASRIVLAMMKQGLYWESVLWCHAYANFNRTFQSALENLVPPTDSPSLFYACFFEVALPLLNPFMDALLDFRICAPRVPVRGISTVASHRTLEEATGSKQSHVQIQKDLEAAMTKVRANADQLRKAYRTVSETFLDSFITKYQEILSRHQEFLTLDWLQDTEKKTTIRNGPNAVLWLNLMRRVDACDIDDLLARNFSNILAKCQRYGGGVLG